MSTIRLWLRLDKISKDGKAPLHLIYQVRGSRKYHNVGVKLFPISWRDGEQKAIYVDKKIFKSSGNNPDFMPLSNEIVEVNQTINRVKDDIANIEKRFGLDKRPYSAEMVIETLSQQKKPTTKKEIKTSVVDFIHQYAEDSFSTKRTGSITCYKNTANHLYDFETKNSIKITFENIDISALKQFQNHLITVRGLNNITVAKQLSTLKTILDRARKEYKINVNQDYRDFALSRNDRNFEVIVLTDAELQNILGLDLSENKRLDKVRDIFIFSCTTGLRFSDLSNLKREHIRDGAIKKTAIKTTQKLDVPLNAISEAILDKYSEQHKPLPIISSQKLNAYIKELGELAGIDTPIEKVREYGAITRSAIFKKYELMSIHMGRRTFATLSLERGISSQDVMAMTGHTTYTSFKRYVNVSNERKKTVMAKAWGATKSKLKAVV